MKIYLKIPSNKKTLREIWTEAECLGVIPAKLLPFSMKMSESYEMNEAELHSLLDEARLFAKDKLLNYLAMAEKTTYDCVEFLKRYHIPEKQIEEVISFAQKHKYLSDERYTELYIQECMLYCKSQEEIKYKLKLKRISSEIIYKKLKELYGDEEEENILNDLIDRLLMQYSGAEPKQLYDKCATSLYRKGFKYNEFCGLLSKKLRNNS